MSVLATAAVQRVFVGVDVVRPDISLRAASQLGTNAELLRTVGVPREFGGWFEAREEICCVSELDESSGNEVVIGESLFGNHRWFPESGKVIFCSEDGAREVVSTSLPAFLFFMGRFLQSGNLGWTDSDLLSRDLEEVDSSVLSDSESIWSITLEEVREGYYG